MLKRNASARRAGENRATARFSLPLVAVWMIPLIVTVGAFLFSSIREESALHHELPRTVVLGSTTNSFPTPVDVTVSLSSDAHAVSRTSGMVTGVHLSPATDLIACADLYSVNDVKVRAQVGTSPLVGDVGPGQTGADVTRASQLLADCGLLRPDQVTEKYNASLRKGIDNWNRSAGLPADGVLRSEFTVYAAPGTRAEDILVRAGDSISAGDDTTTLAPEVRSIVISAASEATLAALGTEAVTLTFGTETLAVPSLTAVDDIPALLDILDRAVATGTAQKETSESTLKYTGGVAQLAGPRTFATVPNSAVFVAESGQACIFILGDGGDATALTVPEAIPDSASLGVTLIPETNAGERVLTNQRDATEAVRGECE